MEIIYNISILCSYIGYQALKGDVEAVKFLYSTIWREHPAFLKTNDQLQNEITSIEITNDTGDIYDVEFLYYWGMICLGEQSPIVVKNLGTAETCFQKIEEVVPQVKARLAYINLLKSTEPAKYECNIHRLEILRQCANRQRDLFSMIVLAKICFYNFLEEQQENNPDVPLITLPTRALWLLELPCQQGHPVAIRFWNEMLTCIGTPEAVDMRLSENRIRAEVLLDFKTSANMQIRL